MKLNFTLFHLINSDIGDAATKFKPFPSGCRERHLPDQPGSLDAEPNVTPVEQQLFSINHYCC